MVEWEETSKMAAFIFLVAYCPIINTKLSQLGSVSNRFLNVYPCLICRKHFYNKSVANKVENPYNAHFSLKFWRLLKTRLHSTRVKRKRCYDVRLSRQEGSTRRHLGSAQYWDRPAGGNTGRLFLAFGGPVCADRISNCPLDRMY